MRDILRFVYTQRERERVQREHERDFKAVCHSNRARTRTRKTVDGLQGGSSIT